MRTTPKGGRLYDSRDGKVRVTMEWFSQAVLTHLRRRRWLKPGDRVGVAVSGGADSVALLRALLELRGELGIVLSVVHFNHTLRAEESEADHAFVQDLSRAHDLELHAARGDVAARAQQRSLSTEAAAREARYEFFWSLIQNAHLDKIATAHTVDDQAETVLLRLIRGTGTRGLGGIHPQLTSPASGLASRGSIIRPLLHTRRREVESYLRGLGQSWREDSSNRDLHHTRNRVRQVLIPLLEKDFNPEVAERLADFSEIARAEEEYWEVEERILSANSFNVSILLALPLALRRRCVRAAAPPGLQLEFQQVEAILEVAAGGDDGPTVCNLAAGWVLRRDGNQLAFVPPKSRQVAAKNPPTATLGELRLLIPGTAHDPGTGQSFAAKRISLGDSGSGYNSEHLYAPHLLPSDLLVRTWRFGDRFWPAHTKAPKKLKELFQERKIAAELRAGWPVMVAERDGEQEVVWVQGFAAPAHLRPGPGGGEAILIEMTNVGETT